MRSLRSNKRRGTALIVVLVVIVMMTLAAYTFSESMIVERQASDRYGREAAARAFADSGIELAAAWIGTPADEHGSREDFYNNPGLFGGVVVADSEEDRRRGRVSLIAPVASDSSGTKIRVGMTDESSKLNLNALLGFGLDPVQTREMLMYLPNMTEDVADAILDWMDDDDETREHGAESDYYLPAYSAKNGPLESIDELLSVAGVTPGLLYGEDTNRNGLLDPNENDQDASAPLDDGDGQLNAGWAAFLTVRSRESNRRSDGSPKIDLNQSLLTELYDELEEAHGTEVATFITAYRLSGSTNIEKIEPPSSSSATGSGAGTGTGGNSGSGSSSGSGSGSSSGSRSGSGSSSSSTGGGTLSNAQLQQGAQAVAGAVFGGSGKVTRGGMDLSAGSSYEFYSLYDLIAAEVTVQIDGNSTTLVSPWTSDPGDLTEHLPMLFDSFALSDAEFTEGRINVNQASYEVLQGLPGMPPELASQIADNNQTGSEKSIATDLTRQTTGWLLIDGLTDQLTMRKLDRYLTVRGDVYRVTSVGHFDQGGPLVRVEAIIDGTLVPPRVVFQRDLTHLGPGYRIEQLSQLSAR